MRWTRFAPARTILQKHSACVMCLVEDFMRKSIVLTSAALFVAVAAGAPSPAVAKVKHKPISITKKIDKASPNLYRASTAPRDVATGQASGKRQYGPVR